MNSLYIAAAGMNGQQINIDVISNNLANVNTPGFKKSQISFKDLYYRDISGGGKKSIKAGMGSGIEGVNRVFAQGSFRETGNILDLAIEGDGFFKILLPDGSIGFTRDGSFRIDSDGRIVTVDGYRLEPPIIIDQSFSEITVSSDGVVRIRPIGSEEMHDVGNINIVKFNNPSGLESISGNAFRQTEASGPPMNDNGNSASSIIRQGFLENANINVVEEMTNLIIAQRAFEINSKVIKASDDMMGITNNIR